MDTLGEILDLLRFKGAFYFRTNFHPPWGIEVPEYKNVARFHYVAQGHFWIKTKNMPKPQKLSVGDFVIIPHGSSHTISDQYDSPIITLDEAFTKSDYQEGKLFNLGKDDSDDESTQLLCGHFQFDQQYSHTLIDNLPNYIIQNSHEDVQHYWLKNNLQFMEYIAKNNSIGDIAIIKRLSEIVFIQVIKDWHNKQNNPKGFIAALNDPRLSKGIMAFHNHYSKPWTVEKLAKESFMSRSSFFNKFKQYLNITPMQYIISWRIEIARKMLSETNMSTSQIALEVGYASVAAFNKAFKRISGINPGKYRKNK